jgi:hypothetical protein
MGAPFGGSAADEARDAHECSGKFKKGHEKLGGRERGTPNLLSADYKKLLFEAAYRIGSDGNGKDGVTGYFQWVAQYHPGVFVIQLLCGIPDLGEMPTEPCRTAEELNREICDYIGLSNTHPNAGPTNAARNDSIADMVPGSRHRRGKSSQQDWDWTGRNDETGIMMRLAVEKPKVFCKLVGKAFLSIPKNKRGTGPCHT